MPQPLSSDIRVHIEAGLKRQGLAYTLLGAASLVTGIGILALIAFLPANTPEDVTGRNVMAVFALFMLVSGAASFWFAKFMKTRVWYLLEEAPGEVTRIESLNVMNRGRLISVSIQIHNPGPFKKLGVLMPSIEVRQQVLEGLKRHLPNAHI